MNTQKQPKARVLAYYLPQFHPIPENDEWWGKGFTEWTNVGKAKPLFPGHYQPHVPADLGYYDLRVPETRKAQADMAREYGVEGFVYWHYWFGNGKRLLERPFNEVLASGEPDFPFALAWANETWSGSFHGLRQGKVLIEQTYPGDEDYIAHFNAVLPAFKDKRYITCEGKPVFFVYLVHNLPDAKHFTDLWQKMAQENGLKGIYFVGIEDHMFDETVEKNLLKERVCQGFSAIAPSNMYKHGWKRTWKMRLVRKVFYKLLHWIPNVVSYDVNSMRSPMDEDERVMPMVYPGWDHTPRTGKRGVAVVGATPYLFGEAVRHAVEVVAHKPEEKRFIMVKSWNEWAEGNYLEPDFKWGRQYLEELKKAVYND